MLMVRGASSSCLDRQGTGRTDLQAIDLTLLPRQGVEIRAVLESTYCSVARCYRIQLYPHTSTEQEKPLPIDADTELEEPQIRFATSSAICFLADIRLEDHHLETLAMCDNIFPNASSSELPV